MIDDTIYDKLYSAVGSVVIAVTNLENDFERLAQALITDSQFVGRIITSQLSISNIQHTIRSIYKYKFGTDESSSIIESFLKRADKIYEERNKIVHSQWHLEDQENFIRIKTTARKEIKHYFEKLDLNKFKALKAKANVLSQEVNLFTFDNIMTGKFYNASA